MPVDWADARGLFLGFSSLLTDDERVILAAEFDRYAVLTKGQVVRDAGHHLWLACQEETLTRCRFRKTFQAIFLSLFRAARTGNSLAVSCGCPHHRNIANDTAFAISENRTGWIADLLHLVGVADQRATRHLLAQLPSHDARTASEYRSVRLSRFMELDTFVRCYTNTGNPDLALRRATEELSPLRTPTLRRDALKNDTVARLRGRLGSYPHFRGVVTRYKKHCDEFKSFATFQEAIDANARLGPPDLLLSAAGMPFEPGERWIELQFSAEAALIEYERGPKLAVPTCVDAKGNWVFTPQRDRPPLHGYARDLRDGDRGLPEVLHEPLDLRLIDDAIVWAEVTASAWSTASALI